MYKIERVIWVYLSNYVRLTFLILLIGNYLLIPVIMATPDNDSILFVYLFIYFNYVEEKNGK